MRKWLDIVPIEVPTGIQREIKHICKRKLPPPAPPWLRHWSNSLSRILSEISAVKVLKTLPRNRHLTFPRSSFSNGLEEDDDDDDDDGDGKDDDDGENDDDYDDDDDDEFIDDDDDVRAFFITILYIYSNIGYIRPVSRTETIWSFFQGFCAR